MTDVERHRLVVAAAGQHADEPARHLDVVGVVGEAFATQLVGDQLLGTHPFGTGVDVGQRRGDHLVVDALGPQLSGQRALALSGVHPSRPHPLLGEVRVVDQADVGQPVQDFAR